MCLPLLDQTSKSEQKPHRLKVLAISIPTMEEAEVVACTVEASEVHGRAKLERSTCREETLGCRVNCVDHLVGSWLPVSLKHSGISVVGIKLFRRCLS